MSYQFKTFIPTQDNGQKMAVEQVYNRERDLRQHQQVLSRYKEALKDENFVGRTYPDGTTFRQKMEQEIPILEGAIQECLRLIEVETPNLPTQDVIDITVAQIEGKEVLPPLP